MIEILKDVPQNIVAAKATGDVNKDEYKNVLIPALDALSISQDSLNLLMLVDTKASNFSPATWSEDVIVVLKNFTKWNRVAIVTDEDGIRTFADTFGKVIPGEFKGFSVPKFNEAKEWVSGN